MQAVYYKLKEPLGLRGWQKLPWAVVNQENGKTAFLSRREFEALSFCDGATDIQGPTVFEPHRKLIAKAEEMGLVENCGAASPEKRCLKERQRYKLYPARYVEAAQWSITGNCNYRCRHCYM